VGDRLTRSCLWARAIELLERSFRATPLDLDGPVGAGASGGDRGRLTDVALGYRGADGDFPPSTTHSKRDERPTPSASLDERLDQDNDADKAEPARGVPGRGALSPAVVAPLPATVALGPGHGAVGGNERGDV